MERERGERSQLHCDHGPRGGTRDGIELLTLWSQIKIGPSLDPLQARSKQNRTRHMRESNTVRIEHLTCESRTHHIEKTLYCLLRLNLIVVLYFSCNFTTELQKMPKQVPMFHVESTGVRLNVLGELESNTPPLRIEHLTGLKESNTSQV